MPAGANPSTVYVGAFVTNQIYPVNTATGAIGSSISTGLGGNGINNIALDSTGTRIYVAYQNNGQVPQYVTISTGQVTPISTPGFSWSGCQQNGIEAHPTNTSLIFITCYNDHVYEVNVVTGDVVQLDGGNHLGALYGVAYMPPPASNPKLNQWLVADRGTQHIWMISPNCSVAALPLPINGSFGTCVGGPGIPSNTSCKMQCSTGLSPTAGNLTYYCSGITANFTSFAQVTCNDTTPPQFTSPRTIYANTTSASVSGMNVTYNVTALDFIDGPSNLPVITCSPPSGTFFNIGNSIVTCAAMDLHGNVNTTNFTINVQLCTPRLQVIFNSANNGDLTHELTVSSPAAWLNEIISNQTAVAKYLAALQTQYFLSAPIITPSSVTWTLSAFNGANSITTELDLRIASDTLQIQLASPLFPAYTTRFQQSGAISASDISVNYVCF